MSQYDELVSQPTLADEDQERKETEKILGKLKAAVSQQKQKQVAQDLEIIIRNVELGFRQQDFKRAHEVLLAMPASGYSAACACCWMSRLRLSAAPRPSPASASTLASNRATPR